MAEKVKKSSSSSRKTPTKTSTLNTPQAISSKVNATREKFSNRNVKIIALVAVIFILVILLAYLFKGVFVAATVNGEPISRLAVVKALEKQSGAMVLENMITKKIILQEARKRNINVTQSDLDNEIKTISENLKEQGTTLENAMEAQGMTREELNGELRVQLALRKMTEGEIKVTDAEIQDFITTNQAQFAEGTTESQMRELAKTQLEQQKTSEKTQALIADLQKKAKIMHFAGY